MEINAKLGPLAGIFGVGGGAIRGDLQQTRGEERRREYEFAEVWLSLTTPKDRNGKVEEGKWLMADFDIRDPNGCM